MNVETLLVTSATAILRQNMDRINSCLPKLTEDQIWARGTENENAVGNLILHLNGNVRQWIISALGGAPDIRERDKEFDTAGGLSGPALFELLQSTMSEAIRVIEGLTTEQLLRSYQAQNRTATGVEAVMKVTEHFSQ